jgi:hypothetical protein
MSVAEMLTVREAKIGCTHPADAVADGELAKKYREHV